MLKWLSVAPFGEPVVHAVLGVSRAGEHHVLEHVREAGVVEHLVLRAHVIPDVDRHGRRGMIRRENDVETVGELDLLEGNSNRVATLLRGGDVRNGHRQRGQNRNEETSVTHGSL